MPRLSATAAVLLVLCMAAALHVTWARPGPGNMPGMRQLRATDLDDMKAHVCRKGSVSHSVLRCIAMRMWCRTSWGQLASALHARVHLACPAWTDVRVHCTAYPAGQLCGCTCPAATPHQLTCCYPLSLFAPQGSDCGSIEGYSTDCAALCSYDTTWCLKATDFGVGTLGFGLLG